jgi:hypothetical protein
MEITIIIDTWCINTGDPPYHRVSNPWIYQLQINNIGTSCVCIESTQTFFLSLFLKQRSIITIYIVLGVSSNLEIIQVFGRIRVNTILFYLMDLSIQWFWQLRSLGANPLRCWGTTIMRTWSKNNQYYFNWIQEKGCDRNCWVPIQHPFYFLPS